MSQQLDDRSLAIGIGIGVVSVTVILPLCAWLTFRVSSDMRARLRNKVASVVDNAAADGVNGLPGDIGLAVRTAAIPAVEGVSGARWQSLVHTHLSVRAGNLALNLLALPPP